MIGFAELAIVGVVAVILFRKLRWTGATLSPIRHGWLFTGLVAAGTGLLRNLDYIEYLSPYFLLSQAILGALLYLLIGATGRTVSLLAIALYALAYHFARIPLQQTVSAWQAGAFENESPLSILSMWADPALWTFVLREFFTPGNLVENGLVATLALTLASRSHTRGASGRALGAYGGDRMDKRKNETTRWALASAVLSGSFFRRRVIARAEKPVTAVAPELDLDYGLLLAFSRHLERRETKYRLLFSALGAVTVLVFLPFPLLGLLFLFGIYSLQLHKLSSDRRFVLSRFKREAFDPEHIRAWLAAEALPRPEAIPSKNQNVLVYSGFTPFVGAGFEVGRWTITVDTSRPRKDLDSETTVTTFDACDLDRAIHEALRQMGIDGLSMRDYAFVHGVEIPPELDILPDRFSAPRQTIPSDTLDHITRNADPRIRHYKWIQVSSWAGDMILSYFLRLNLQGKTLFVEVTRYLLPPLQTEFRKVDAIPDPSWRTTLAQAVEGAVRAPFTVIASAVLLVGQLLRELNEVFETEWRAIKRAIRLNPLFDYGIATSLRQELSSNEFVTYYQRMDKELYEKAIERQVLDAIVDFLDGHGIDVSSLKEGRSTILNTGILVQRGDVKAETLAVGKGAKAILARAMKGRSGPATATGE